jgi:succinate dehydrogenase assembly factor 1
MVREAELHRFEKQPYLIHVGLLVQAGSERCTVTEEPKTYIANWALTKVLHLYRACIRAAYKKPMEYRQNWIAYVKDNFVERSHINPRDFTTIEHFLRRGHILLEQFSSPSIKNVSR